VFAIKGRSADSVPFVAPKPSVVEIKPGGKKAGKGWLYIIGVDSGKSRVMSALKVQEPGPRYCHFPDNEECGYDETYFNGLLSERMERVRSGGRYVWKWTVIKGHERNEALDCRNYAMAAFAILSPDMYKAQARVKGTSTPKQAKPKKRPRQRRGPSTQSEDW
jgi:phage terminase large subunit GpA-like protein